LFAVCTSFHSILAIHSLSSWQASSSWQAAVVVVYSCEQPQIKNRPQRLVRPADGLSTMKVFPRIYQLPVLDLFQVLEQYTQLYHSTNLFMT